MSPDENGITWGDWCEAMTKHKDEVVNRVMADHEVLAGLDAFRNGAWSDGALVECIVQSAIRSS